MKTLKFLAILMVAVCGTLTLTSCPDDDEVTKIANITGNYDGNVSITNLTTNEVVTHDIATAIITVNGASTTDLKVKNGDKIKVQYTLDDNYKEYPPTVTVSVGDASPIQLTSDSYEFVVSGLTANANQKVTCQFSYSKSTDYEQISLGGVASFVLTLASDNTAKCQTCSCDAEKCSCSGTASFSRTVSSSAKNVKNGETVTLSLQKTLNTEISILTGCDTCTKGAIYTATYFIDGKEVAKSADKENAFTVPVELSGHAQGEHEITAAISVNYDCIKISQSIIPCKVVVE